MLSEALSSIGISLEDIRREAGDTFDMSLPDDRKIAYAPRAKNALVRARKEMRRLGDHADTTTPASYSDSRRQKDAAANREEEVAEERRRA